MTGEFYQRSNTISVLEECNILDDSFEIRFYVVLIAIVEIGGIRFQIKFSMLVSEILDLSHRCV